MGFSYPPASCSYISGKFRYVKEIDQKIKEDIRSERSFMIVNVVICVVLVVLGCVLFNFIFSRLFKRIMHEKIDKSVEEAIGNYRAVVQDENEGYEI